MPRQRFDKSLVEDRDEGETDDGQPLIRLQRYLAMAGLGSRRHCEEFILTGRVTVDRQTITELGVRVDPEKQKICLDGERVVTERKVYYLLNKPIGVLCTNADPEGRSRVIDLFPRQRERLFTVGRLDEHSQGLLLVTNDGDLAHRLAHPRFEVPKVYRVQVMGTPSREVLEQLRKGETFSEGRFKVESARILKVKGPSSQLEIVLREGQNREIRRLLARQGHKVQKLERVALGPLRLGPLPPGAYRPLLFRELNDLRKLVSGKVSAGRGPRSKGAGRPKRPGGKRVSGSRRPGGKVPAGRRRGRGRGVDLESQ